MGNHLEGTFPGSYYIASCEGKSGRVSSWSEEWKADVKKYLEVQMEVFERETRGWMFWNFKTEGEAGEWDLGQLVEEGVWPDLREMGRGWGEFCGGL